MYTLNKNKHLSLMYTMYTHTSKKTPFYTRITSYEESTPWIISLHKMHICTKYLGKLSSSPF